MKLASVLVLVLLSAIIFLSGCIDQNNKAFSNVSTNVYKYVTTKPTGWFITGQDADIMLSGVDFNNAGGPLFFNHPGNIASDGTHLILADRNNNRVLIWNKLPASNTNPDIVLGQEDFISNNPGTALNQMNWPIGVATDGKHLLVTDVENNRVLIWNGFPTTNGQPADLALGGVAEESRDRRGIILWPWSVWTDGEKLIVTSTAASQVLIWDSFPTQNNQKSDIVIQLPDRFGTPRSIGSDGKHLSIGDHNAFGNMQGTFFWKSFPTQNDQMYDFFIADPETIGSNGPINPRIAQGMVLWGQSFTKDGKFLALSNKICIWNSFPENENDSPDFYVGAKHTGAIGYDFGGGQGGDGSSIAVVNERMYMSLSNGNKIVGFSSFPTKTDQIPDIVIGSPDIYKNTLQTEFIISNPFPITDGKSLFVVSDFDGNMYVWKNLPDESGAKPDLVYKNIPASSGFIFNNMLAIGGKGNILIWKKLPLNGEKPDIVFKNSIGNATFNDVKGLAMDEKYFYVADNLLNKIYLWEGMPNENSNPKFVLTTDRPERLSTDDRYLVVASQSDRPGGSVKVYKIDELTSDSQPGYINFSDGSVSGGHFNLPGHAIVKDNHLFVADTNFNRVLIWNRIEDALDGKNPDILLGAEDLNDGNAEIGKDKLFMPHSLAFDGSFLWVGEVKFSERILRFGVS